MMLPPWVVIETKSSAEETVERSLRAAGYRTCLPRYRKLLNPHGRERRPVTAMRPLFARVVFVQDWRGWPGIPISGTLGLMLVRPGVPAEVPDHDIASILERERACEFDELQIVNAQPIRRSDLALGQDVEFEEVGVRVLGILDDLSDSGQAVVRALMFGRIIPATVDAERLRKVI